MKTINIDGSKTKTLKKFYTYIAKVLHFPSYFGNNMDALVDCLRDLPEPVMIEISHRNDFICKNPGKREIIAEIFDNADMVKWEREVTE